MRSMASDISLKHYHIPLLPRRDKRRLLDDILDIGRRFIDRFARKPADVDRWIILHLV